MERNKTNPESLRSTGMSWDDFYKLAAEQEAHDQARDRRTNSTNVTAASSNTESAISGAMSKDLVPIPKSNGEKRNRRIRSGTIAAVAVLAVAGVSVGFNVGGSQQLIQSLLQKGNDGHLQSNGMVVENILTTGQAGFKSEFCDRPIAVVMVATVSGYMDLVPILSKTGSDGKVVTGPVNKYMTKQHAPNVGTPENIAIFKDNITPDGYQHAQLASLSMGVTVCEPLGSGAIVEEPNGSYTIHRDLLKVTFNDPARLLNTDINIVNTVRGTKDYADLDPSKQQNMMLPNRIFLDNGVDSTGKIIDPALKESYEELSKNLNSYDEGILIKALMEQSFIGQLDDVISMPKIVSTPNGDTKLQDQLDDVIKKKLIGNSTEKVATVGNYDPQPYIPFDATTKMPITANVLKNLVRLDPSQVFHITSADITYGSVNGLKSSPTPLPEPSQSASPSPKPTATTAP
jgi:hypothetical protein